MSLSHCVLAAETTHFSDAIIHFQSGDSIDESTGNKHFVIRTRRITVMSSRGRRTRQRRAVCSQQSHHDFRDVPIKIGTLSPTNLAPSTIRHTAYLDIKYRGFFIRKRRERDRQRTHELGDSEHCRREQGKRYAGGRDTPLFQQPGAAAGIQRKEVTGVQRTMFCTSAHLSSRAISASLLAATD